MKVAFLIVLDTDKPVGTATEQCVAAMKLLNKQLEGFARPGTLEGSWAAVPDHPFNRRVQELFEQFSEAANPNARFKR